MIVALLLGLLGSDDLPAGASAATRALFVAVERGDGPAVARALKQKGVEVNARTQREADTPLMLAANSGSVELVRLLLQAGADPNLAPHSRYHHGPLFYALMGRKRGGPEKSLEQINAVVKALIDAKADPNLAMSQGEFMPRTTPTLVAATLEPTTLALFLGGGGDPNVVQSDGRDGLALAAEERDEPAALEKVELMLKAGAKLPGDDKGRLLLLARALDQGKVTVTRRLLAAGCTLAAKSEYAPMLAAAAASSGDAALYDELIQGVDCKSLEGRGLVAVALHGLERADAGKRERVLGLAKRLHACGAGLQGALVVAASAGDAPAFAWVDALDAAPLEADKNGRTALHWAALGGDPVIVQKLLARGGALDEGRDGPLALAARERHAAVVGVLWPRASTSAREAAVSVAADAACEKNAERAGELFGALARLGVESVPDKVRGCNAEAWRGFHAARRDLEAAQPGTREYDALVFGGDAVSAEGWEAGARALLEKAAPWVLPLGPYPRRVRSDTVSGMNPGFDVVLLGLCAPEQSGSRLEALKAFYPGVYVKRVSAKAAEVGCPLVLEQPLVAANKSARAGGDTVSVSILRRGRARSCVAVRVGARGGLSSFSSQALETAPSCPDYEEAVALDGCTVRCAGKTTRVRLKP